MKKIFFFLVILLAPLSLFAAGGGTLVTVIDFFMKMIKMLLPICASLAFLGFFYGLAQVIWNARDEKTLAEHKSFMIWSILALFVMMSIMGIIGFLERSLGTSQGPDAIKIEVPQL